MTTESKTFKIYIYQNQLNKKKFEKFIKGFEGLEGLKYNGHWYVGWFSIGSVTISRNMISVFYYEDDVDIKNKLLNHVKENLNAESIIVSENENSERIKLDKYKPSWYNRLKYKIKNKINKW